MTKSRIKNIDLMQLLERESRREKTLESRSKDNKTNKNQLRTSAPAAVSNSPSSVTEENKTFVFEPPTDMVTMATTDPASQRLEMNEDTVRLDENLQSSEELFFDIINQVVTLKWS